VTFAVTGKPTTLALKPRIRVRSTISRRHYTGPAGDVDTYELGARHRRAVAEQVGLSDVPSPPVVCDRDGDQQAIEHPTTDCGLVGDGGWYEHGSGA
jgi:hypothetical protein